MAATLTELESALNSLTTRIEQIERLIANLVSTRQLNQISLIVESDIGDLQTDVATLKSQVTTLEGIVANLS